MLGIKRRGGAGRAALSQGRSLGPGTAPQLRTREPGSVCPVCLLPGPAEPRNALKSSLCTHTHAKGKSEVFFSIFFSLIHDLHGEQQHKVGH